MASELERQKYANRMKCISKFRELEQRNNKTNPYLQAFVRIRIKNKCHSSLSSSSIYQIGAVAVWLHPKVSVFIMGAPSMCQQPGCSILPLIGKGPISGECWRVVVRVAFFLSLSVWRWIMIGNINHRRSSH